MPDSKHHKPAIFFSHSSRDKDVINRLGAKLRKKTAGTIDVFIASDGQSIELGQNWVYEIQEALDRSKIMFVFLSPNSINDSKWVHFEAGYAYRMQSDKRLGGVVPVGILGADLTTVGFPLQLLQGFNVTSTAGLNNIIKKINDTLGSEHELLFSDDEFDEIFEDKPRKNKQILGEHSHRIERVKVIIDTKSNLTKATSMPADLAEYLAKNQISSVQHRGSRSKTISLSCGVDITGEFNSVANQDSQYLTTFDIVPYNFDKSIRVVETIAREHLGYNLSKSFLLCHFRASIGHLSNFTEIASHVHSEDYKLIPLNDSLVGFKTDRLDFFVTSVTHPGSSRTSAKAGFRLNCDLDDSWTSMGEMIEFLFARGILFEDHQASMGLPYQ